MSQSSVTDAVITTADGVVCGQRGAHLARWRGIPYAAAPVGELRFRAPQPVQPWTGVREATEFGLAAIQPRWGTQIGPRRAQPSGEDCLTLNVVAPAAPSPTPRPVMVFIHGGAYFIGTTALRLYSGSRLALRGDVVVVSINYRLGAFGYVDFGEFSTPESPFDSNLGLRDQVAALEWVRRNIAAFGGDPENVTVFGESAGAHAVLALLATPAAAGLFHRGIAQSPPADWGVPREDARAFARGCVGNLGATSDNAATMLREASTHDIRRAVERQMARDTHERPGAFAIAPEVDGDYLPKLPITAIIEGSAHAVPLIIGTNLDEARLFVRFDDTLPTTPDRLRGVLSGSREAESRIAAAYPGYPAPKAAVRAGGDYMFLRPSLQVMEAHSRRAPTYAYRFDYAPRAVRLAGFGATHALDLLPVFGGVDSAFGRATTIAGGHKGFRAVQREFQDNWLAFARTGKPLATWPEYSAERRTTRVIDYPPRLEVDPEKSKRVAWESVRVPVPE